MFFSQLNLILCISIIFWKYIHFLNHVILTLWFSVGLISYCFILVIYFHILLKIHTLFKSCYSNIIYDFITLSFFLYYLLYFTFIIAYFLHYVTFIIYYFFYIILIFILSYFYIILLLHYFTFTLFYFYIFLLL